METKLTALIFIPNTMHTVSMSTNYNHKHHHHHHQQISNEDKLPAIALIIIVPLIVWLIFKQQDK